LGPTVKFTDINGFMFSIAQITPVTRVAQNTDTGQIAPPGSHFLEFQVVVTNLQTDRPAPGLPSFLVLPYLPYLQFGTAACTGAGTASSCAYIDPGNALSGELGASESVVVDIDSYYTVADSTSIGTMEMVWNQGTAVLPLAASSSSAAAGPAQASPEVTAAATPSSSSASTSQSSSTTAANKVGLAGARSLGIVYAFMGILLGFFLFIFEAPAILAFAGVAFFGFFGIVMSIIRG